MIIKCPYCTQKIQVNVPPSKLKDVQKWEGKSFGFKECVALKEALLFGLAVSIFSSFIFFLASIRSFLPSWLFFVPLLLFLGFLLSSIPFFLSPSKGLTICPYCKKRILLIGVKEGKMFDSALLESTTLLSKKILNKAGNYGGILDLPKLIILLDEPINKIRDSLKYLKNEGLAEEVSQGTYSIGGLQELREREKQVISFAVETKGKFDLPDLCQELDWSSTRAKTVLKGLKRRDIALKEKTGGRIRWYFPGFMSEEQNKEE